MKTVTHKRLLILLCLIMGAILLVAGMGSVPRIAASVSPAQKEQERKAVASSPSGLKPLPSGFQTPPDAQGAASTESEPANGRIPLHVVYGQVFRHIKDLNRQADKEELNGKDGKHFRTLYQRMAKLKDRDAIALDHVAAETIKEMDKLDAEAAHLIKKFRQMNPKGSAGLGTPRPKPPAELMTLLKARREKILAARNKLFQALGDEEFGRFEKFLYDQIVPDIQRIDLTPPLSNQ